MSAPYFQLDTPLPARGLWAVPVPWHLVPALTTSPNAPEIVATLYVDPPTKRAAAVLWPGVDPRWVVALLAKLEQEHQSHNPPPPSPRAKPAANQPSARKKAAKKPTTRTPRRSSRSTQTSRR